MTTGGREESRMETKRDTSILGRTQKRQVDDRKIVDKQEEEEEDKKGKSLGFKPFNDNNYENETYLKYPTEI